MNKIKITDIFSDSFKSDLKEIDDLLNSINDSSEKISIKGIQKLIDFGKKNSINFDENSLSGGYYIFLNKKKKVKNIICYFKIK